MKLLDEFLGFAVLTGPLWLILILLPVAFWVAIKVAKRSARTNAKIAIGFGVFAVLILALLADEIVGRIYLSHLCTTQAGAKVYQTIELPMEYWDEQGGPKFLNARGIIVDAVLKDRFKWHSVDEPYVNRFVRIEKNRWLIQDQKTKQDLGEKVTFNRYFGWLNRFSTAPNVAESCRDLWADKYGQDALFQKENSEEKAFLLKIFTQTTSSR